MTYEEAVAALQAMDGKRVRVNVQHRWQQRNDDDVKFTISGGPPQGEQAGWDISAAFTATFDFSRYSRYSEPMPYLDEEEFVSAEWATSVEILAIRMKQFLITIQVF